MSQFFQIHPVNPQARLIKQAAQIIHGGGIVAVPTDSCYALVCHLDDKGAGGAPAPHPRHRRKTPPDPAVPRPQRNRRVCPRRQPPVPPAEGGHAGPFTFILEATKCVPRRLSHPSRKTIGLRVPEDAIINACWKNWPAAAGHHADHAGRESR
jgi:hypothetical protein